MVDSYFFDTYALWEAIKGNKNYGKYVHCDCNTSLFNLVELYFALLRESNAVAAAAHYRRLKSCLIEINDEDVFEAMELKLSKKHANLSYADCVGYVMARHLGVKFLTGDEAFRKMQGVEFVK
ncbi:MAG: PIN domain-containing protein [Candidatus Micrarchaeia archaeon]